ncbi:hypothetical protein E2320_007357, partial [Naja naja]
MLRGDLSQSESDLEDDPLTVYPQPREGGGSCSVAGFGMHPMPNKPLAEKLGIQLKEMENPIAFCQLDGTIVGSQL